MQCIGQTIITFNVTQPIYGTSTLDEQSISQSVRQTGISAAIPVPHSAEHRAVKTMSTWAPWY